MTPFRKKQIGTIITDSGEELSDYIIEDTSSDWFVITYQLNPEFKFELHNRTITCSPGPGGRPNYIFKEVNYEKSLARIKTWIGYVKENNESEIWFQEKNSKKEENEEKLNQDIENSGREYKFPEININEEQLEWLKIIYHEFVSGRNPSYRNLIAANSDKFGTTFNPSDISEYLLENRDKLTLLGLYHVHKKHKLLDVVEDILSKIKKILKTENANGNHIEKISSITILDGLNNVSFKELKLAVDLISPFRIFYRGLSYGENETLNLDVGSDEIYKNYLKFEGLEKLVNETYKFSKKLDDITIENILGSISSTHKIKTKRKDFTINDDAIEGVINIHKITEEFSKILIGLSKVEKGNLVGIFGKWGRGKTFFLRHIKEYIKKHNGTKFEFVSFNAWKYQNSTSLWAYLYEQFSNEYFKSSSSGCWVKRKWNQFTKNVRLNLDRNGVFNALLFLATIVFLIFNIYWSLSANAKFLNFILSGTSFFTIVYLLKKNITEYKDYAIETLKKYSGRKEFKELLGNQAEIQKELIILVRNWVAKSEKRIMLIVDDIDRCNEDKIIDIIDSLRIMLDDEYLSKKIIILAAIDERILKSAIRQKIKSLDDELGSELLNERVKEYFDKLFITGIKLGDISASDSLEILSSLTKMPKKAKTKNEIIDYESTRQTENDQESESMSKFLTLAGDKEVYADQVEEKSIKNENTTELVLENNNVIEELSVEEHQMLKESLQSFQVSTPRQIRIFYYRYLLARNLLEVYNPSNTWSEADKQILPDLILSTSLNLSAIEKFYETEEPFYFKINIEKKEYVIDSELRNELLNVVEMTVPY